MSWIAGVPAVFVGLMGLCFFLPPIGVILYKLIFRLGCKKAYGTCLRIERNYDPDSESTLIQPVIQFTNEEGGVTEVKTGTTYGLRYMPRVRDTVKLYYRPDTFPIKFQVASRGLWQVSAMLMAAGLVIMLPAILFLILGH